MPEMLDEFDRKILDLLQHDAGLSTAEIAEKVGLTQSPCWRRINRLEEDGYIQARVALLDRKKLGLGAQVFAHVKLSGHGRKSLPEFEAAVRDLPEVMECYTIFGETDFILRVVTKNMDAYERFLREYLFQLPTVQEVHSSVVGSEIKHETALPITAAVRP